MFKRSHGMVLSLAFGLLLSVEGAAFAQTYYVRSGDSLFTIATRYGMSTQQLQAVNGLSSNYIYPGQSLIIPGSTSSNSGSSGSQYKVTSGDTLYLIAKKYGISAASLQQANGLSSSQLYPGQVLTIPTGSSSSGSFSGSSYTVQSSDSLFKIAQRYGTTVAAIQKANGLTGDYLVVGQVLQIPSGNTTTASSGSGMTLNQSDTDLLARLVTAESAGEPFEGQVAVAATVLNRLKDPSYPKTIPGIIYQVTDGIYYQYSPVLDGRINAPASADSYRAVSLALKGWDPSYGAIGFYNPAKTSNSWVASSPVTTTIGDHVFFK